LLLSHTRTALLGLAAGLLIAVLSLFLLNSRVRKFFAAVAALVAVGAVTLASVVTTWLARGQSTSGLTSLTGRTDFWALVLNTPRTRFEEVFGFGLSNASINGLPIDSNWLSSYMQEGLLGVAICAAVLVFLLLAAFFQSSGVRRALALFIIVYCLLASFTEDSFSDASSYMLHLAVAAALILPAYRSRAARAVNSRDVAPSPELVQV
jgi:O-antigen ligase